MSHLIIKAAGTSDGCVPGARNKSRAGTFLKAEASSTPFSTSIRFIVVDLLEHEEK